MNTTTPQQPATDTPRTEMHTPTTICDRNGIEYEADLVDADFARTLERELAAQFQIAENACADRTTVAQELTAAHACIAHMRELFNGIKDYDDTDPILVEDCNTALALTPATCRDRIKELEAAWLNPHALHAHCLRTLTTAQIAHMFGEEHTARINAQESLLNDYRNEVRLQQKRITEQDAEIARQRERAEYFQEKHDLLAKDFTTEANANDTLRAENAKLRHLLEDTLPELRHYPFLADAIRAALSPEGRT